MKSLRARLEALESARRRAHPDKIPLCFDDGSGPPEFEQLPDGRWRDCRTGETTRRMPLLFDSAGPEPEKGAENPEREPTTDAPVAGQGEPDAPAM